MAKKSRPRTVSLIGKGGKKVKRGVSGALRLMRKALKCEIPGGRVNFRHLRWPRATGLRA
ncbi:MAG: hypothetical protein LBN96_00065 [Desulfovibrio sp.]|jgi:hypothetical protein|nr:hypothetical protein [Desulfovibrio sp.]